MNTLLGSTAITARLLDKEKREQHEDALERAYYGDFSVKSGTLGITFREEQQKVQNHIRGDNAARSDWNTLLPAFEEKSNELLNEHAADPAIGAAKMKQWLEEQINGSVKIDDPGSYKSAKLKRMYEYGQHLQTSYMDRSLKQNIAERKVDIKQNYTTGVNDYWVANKDGNPHDAATYIADSFPGLQEMVKSQGLHKSAADEIARDSIQRLVATGDENAAIALRQLADMDAGDGKSFRVMGIVTDKDIASAESIALHKSSIKDKNADDARKATLNNFSKEYYQIQSDLDNSEPGETRDDAIQRFEILRQNFLTSDLDASQRSNFANLLSVMDAEVTGLDLPMIEDDRLEKIQTAYHGGDLATATRLWQIDPMVQFPPGLKRTLLPVLQRESMGQAQTAENAAWIALASDINEKIDMDAFAAQSLTKDQLEGMRLDGSRGMSAALEKKKNEVLSAEKARLIEQNVDIRTPEGRALFLKNVAAKLPMKGTAAPAQDIFTKRTEGRKKFTEELDKIEGAPTLKNLDPLIPQLASALPNDREEMLKEIKSRGIDGRVYKHLRDTLAKTKTEAPEVSTFKANDAAELKAFLGEPGKLMPDVFIGNPAKPVAEHKIAVSRGKKTMMIDGSALDPKDKIIGPVLDPDGKYLMRDGKITKGKDIKIENIRQIDLREAPERVEGKPHYNYSSRGEYDPYAVYRNPDIDGRLYLDYSNNKIPLDKHMVIVKNGNLMTAVRADSPDAKNAISPPFDPNRMLPVKIGNEYTAMRLEDIYLEWFQKKAGDYRHINTNFQILSERTLDQMGAEERQGYLNGMVAGD